MSPTNDPQPGPELDRAIGEALGVEPRLSWQLMNADETASAMPFGSESEGRSWLANKQMASPSPGLYSEYHIGAWREWPRYSTDGNAMLALIDLMAKRGYSSQAQSREKRWGFALFRDSYWCVEYAAAMPHAACLAALKALRSEAAQRVIAKNAAPLVESN